MNLCYGCFENTLGTPLKAFLCSHQGWVCFIPISQGPPASPHEWDWGETPATARLEIKAHVLAILGVFWDQMLFDLPLQNLMHRVHWELMG